jgi:hypothetical protein
MVNRRSERKKQNNMSSLVIKLLDQGNPSFKCGLHYVAKEATRAKLATLATGATSAN